MSNASERSGPVTEPAPESPDVYRPLSLLAVAGFVLAAMFAVLVLLGGLAAFAGQSPKLLAGLLLQSPLDGILVGMLLGERRPARLWGYAGYGVLAVVTILGLGGLVAYSGVQPWIMHSSVWLLLAGAVLASWLARTRIQASEGTLGGESLARWGLGLSLFFGLNYGAYLLSNSFAVRTQAEQAAEEFIGLLKEGKLEQAYIRTLPIRERPGAGEDVRRFIELKHNVSRTPTSPGPFSMFTVAPYVRLIQQAGEAVGRPELIGVEEEFERGGYSVALFYKVETPAARFELVVTAQGDESQDASGVRRFWHVDNNRTGLSTRSSPVLKKAGEWQQDTAREAGRLFEEWAGKVRNGDISLAYLYTLPPEDRKKQMAAQLFDHPSALAATGLGFLGAESVSAETRAAYAAGLKRFREGSLVDFGQFWNESKDRPDMIALTKRIFQGTPEKPGGTVDFRLIDYSPVEEKDGKVAVRVRFRLVPFDETGKSKYMTETEAEVTGPAGERPGGPNEFWITKVWALRSQTVPSMQIAPEKKQ